VDEIRYLANMNISPLTINSLRKADWDIVRVSELLPVNAPDEEILALGRREGRVIVTQDLDFSKLLALSGYDTPSLVSLRLSVSDPETITRRLLDEIPRLHLSLREGSAVTVEDQRVRVRRLPIE
jgi:predicted nuclease of predicted toxin-antitoxin system